MESRQKENCSDHEGSDHEDTRMEVPAFADKEILPGNIHTYYVPNRQIFCF